MKRIEHNGILMATVISINECAGAANFFTENESALQIGLFRYEENHFIQNHVHNLFPRQAEKTCEMLFVLKGSMRADIYTNKKMFLESVNVLANEMIILFDGGHGFEVTSPGTVVLEAKNGPYFGVEKDKIKF